MIKKQFGSLIKIRDQFVGTGVLSGTTAVIGNPDTMVSRFIVLSAEMAFLSGSIRPCSLSFITAKWSGADGSWSFDKLDKGRRYTVVAYDHTGVHDPVIKAGLIPV